MTPREAAMLLEARPGGRPAFVVSRVGESYEVVTPDGMVHPAETKAGLAEFLRTRKQALPGDDVRIEFVNFEADEVNGLFNSIRVQSAGEAEEGRLFGRWSRRGSGRSAFERRLAEYDLKSAEVMEARVRALEGGRSEVATTVRLTAKAAGRPSLWVRIKLVFKNLVGEPTARLKAEIRAAIERFFARDLHEPGMLDTSARELTEALKPYGVENAIIELDDDLLRFDAPAGESRDYLEVRREKENAHGTPGAPGDAAV